MILRSRFVLATALALLLTPLLAEAQRAGFIVGIAPPAPQAFAVAPAFATTQGWAVQGFVPVAPPLMIQQPHVIGGFHGGFPGGFPGGFNLPAGVVYNGPVIVTQPRPHHRVFHGNPGASVIVPGVVIVQPPVSYFGTPPAWAVRPHSIVTPPAPPSPSAPPAVGTGREDVVRTLGVPPVTRITRDGEVLYYSGGITVFIENGQVARPR